MDGAVDVPAQRQAGFDREASRLVDLTNHDAAVLQARNAKGLVAHLDDLLQRVRRGVHLDEVAVTERGVSASVEITTVAAANTIHPDAALAVGRAGTDGTPGDASVGAHPDAVLWRAAAGDARVDARRALVSREHDPPATTDVLHRVDVLVSRVLVDDAPGLAVVIAAQDVVDVVRRRCARTSRQIVGRGIAVIPLQGGVAVVGDTVADQLRVVERVGRDSANRRHERHLGEERSRVFRVLYLGRLPAVAAVVGVVLHAIVVVDVQHAIVEPLDRFDGGGELRSPDPSAAGVHRAPQIGANR